MDLFKWTVKLSVKIAAKQRAMTLVFNFLPLFVHYFQHFDSGNHFKFDISNKIWRPKRSHTYTHKMHSRYYVTMRTELYVTFRGWNSYLTQCWKPLPLIFIDVNTKQFPTKWAVYPTPLDVLKLFVGNDWGKKECERTSERVRVYDSKHTMENAWKEMQRNFK